MYLSAVVDICFRRSLSRTLTYISTINFLNIVTYVFESKAFNICFYTNWAMTCSFG